MLSAFINHVCFRSCRIFLSVGNIANISWRYLVRHISKTMSKWIDNYHWKTQKFVFETYFIVLINIDLHISFPRRIFMDGNCSRSLSLSCFLDRYLLPLNLKANMNIIRGCDGWDNRRMEGEMDIRRITRQRSSHRQHWRMNQERRGSVMDCWSE